MDIENRLVVGRTREGEAREGAAAVKRGPRGPCHEQLCVFTVVVSGINMRWPLHKTKYTHKRVHVKRELNEVSLIASVSVSGL